MPFTQLATISSRRTITWAWRGAATELAFRNCARRSGTNCCNRRLASTRKRFSGRRVKVFRDTPRAAAQAGAPAGLARRAQRPMTRDHVRHSGAVPETGWASQPIEPGAADDAACATERQKRLLRKSGQSDRCHFWLRRASAWNTGRERQCTPRTWRLTAHPAGRQSSWSVVLRLECNLEYEKDLPQDSNACRRRPLAQTRFHP